MLEIFLELNSKGLYLSSEKKRKIDLVFASERAQGTGKWKMGPKQRIKNEITDAFFLLFTISAPFTPNSLKMFSV